MRMAPHKVVITSTVAYASEAFAAPVGRELVRRGFQVHYVCGDRAPELDFEHRSTVLPMDRGIAVQRDAHALREWVSYLRASSPAMVVAGSPKASLLSMTAARIAGVPTRVYVLHGAVWDGAHGNKRRILETAERATLAAATSHVAVSDSLARLVLARRLTTRIPDVIGSGSFCGVDVERFRPGSPEHREPQTIVFVGRLHRDNGIDVLIRTLDRVRHEVAVKLVIVGGLDETVPPDDRTMAAIHERPDIDWVGECDDVLPFLQEATLMLFPSMREGLPQVLLEAQACGLPVVSWQATGVSDAVRDGFTGIAVRLGDEQALAGATTQLLADAPRLRDMSSNARAWAIERFSRSDVVARNCNYLEQRLSEAL